VANNTIKINNNILAVPTAEDAITLNPDNSATIDTIKNVNSECNIWFTPLVDLFTYVQWQLMIL
jgi:hypothetical protein